MVERLEPLVVDQWFQLGVSVTAPLLVAPNGTTDTPKTHGSKSLHKATTHIPSHRFVTQNSFYPWWIIYIYYLLHLIVGSCKVAIIGISTISWIQLGYIDILKSNLTGSPVS